MSNINRKRFLQLSAGSLASLAVSRADAAGTNPIIEENLKQGTSAWIPNNQAWNREIEGYADRTSVSAGQTIRFFVNTASASYSVEVYRLGWYDGNGGRLYHAASNRPGTRQPIPTPSGSTKLVECRWTNPYSIQIPTTWLSGVYLAKLRNKEGKETHVPFVVRDNRVVNHLVQSSVNTWQAYNGWGGYSLYDYNSVNGVHGFKVSFNRPYYNYGSADFYSDQSGWELNTLRFLEREGYNVSYCTNVDTHADPFLLNRCKSFISMGHDEYWSVQQRNAVEAARNRGVHMAFLSSNTCYWQVRFEKGFDGTANRTMVCYKNATKDPFYSSSSTRSQTTVQWRDPIVNRPEVDLMGVQYYYYPVNADMIVRNTNHWVFTGSELTDGMALPGLVGYEADRVTPRTPANTTILAESPINTGSEAGLAHMTIFQHPSGAWVFATGSQQWAWGLDDYFTNEWGHAYVSNWRAQQMMRNILNRFAT